MSYTTVKRSINTNQSISESTYVLPHPTLFLYGLPAIFLLSKTKFVFTVNVIYVKMQIKKSGIKDNDGSNMHDLPLAIIYQEHTIFHMLNISDRHIQM